jgi:hypothetical protein
LLHGGATANPGQIRPTSYPSALFFHGSPADTYQSVKWK